MTKTYEAAIHKHNEAITAFRIVQLAYRARSIGDAEFIAGRKIYDAATTEFDAAFEAEAAR